MLILKGPHGSEFGLMIRAYEIPPVRKDNWLIVGLYVSTPYGYWKVFDPALQTFEIDSIINWFQALAADEETETEKKFAKPHLRFIINGKSGNYINLRIYFEYSVRPSWALYDGEMNDLWVDLQLTQADFRKAAEDLRSELSKFPIRGGILDEQPKE
ncbi:MAG: hypothetical protein WCI77_04105 [Candidatus Omnitrophota bacterium]